MARFKKGEVHNPKGIGGRPVGSFTIPRELKTYNKQIICELMNKYLAMSTLELETIIDNPESPSIDCIVASVIQKAIDFGDMSRLNLILDRMIGKVTEKIDHTSSDGSMAIADYSKLSTEELKDLKKLINKCNVP